MSDYGYSILFNMQRIRFINSLANLNTPNLVQSYFILHSILNSFFIGETYMFLTN